jgi:phosphoglycerate dehydrogenase-like enzyme
VAVCSRSFSQHPVLRAELLARYEKVTFNNAGLSLRGDSLVDFLRGHDKAITALEVVDAKVLSQLPELKTISKYGVGLDTIDQQAMRTYGKRLGWTPGVNRRSVAELVIAFAISMLRHIPAANREVLAGTWRQHVGGQLSGRTIGIVGCGNVGQEVVQLLRPFGCRTLINDIREYPAFYKEYSIEPVSLDSLLADSDVVTLHVPLDETTRGLLHAGRLARMKPTAILINTARGTIVDESALKRALQDGRIAAAAFDVFAAEPPQDNELLSLPNFLATPHIGGSAEEAILAMGRAAIEQLEDVHAVDSRSEQPSA